MLWNVYANGTYWGQFKADTAEEAMQAAADQLGTIDVGKDHASTEGMTAIAAVRSAVTIDMTPTFEEATRMCIRLLRHGTTIEAQQTAEAELLRYARATISGKRFDTDSATLICEAVDSRGHWRAALYKTPRSGAYFIAGQGGPMSIFASKPGTAHWGDGQRIIPLDDRKAAFAWACQHFGSKADLIRSEFGDMAGDS